MPAKVRIELWPPKKPEYAPDYALLARLVKAFHPDLRPDGDFEGARIALGCEHDNKPNKDGQTRLGKCVKLNEIARQLSGFDFVILVSAEVWFDEKWSIEKKAALLDHELQHAARDEDEEDEWGRPVWRVRKHCIGEFRQIIARHGAWAENLEAFANAILEHRKLPLLAELQEIADAVQDAGADGGEVEAVLETKAEVTRKGKSKQKASA